MKSTIRTYEVYDQQQLDNDKFEDITIKRKDQVKTLECLNKPTKINNDTTLHVSPNMLFNRLLLVVKLQIERTQYFDYPLTPELAALFIDGQMRQANKSTLRNNFLKMENRKEDPDSDVCVLMEGI